MAFRTSSSIRSKFTQFYRTYTSNVTEISKSKDSEVAEKVKERVLDRWGKYGSSIDSVLGFTAKYWKNLYIDYKDVAKDVVVGCKERPIRAASYFSFLGSCYYFSRHNPDAVSYRETLIRASNCLMMVGEPIRNPISVRHLKLIEQSFNEGTIRRLSLGVVSLIWLDNYEKECAHYKATCSYLKPQYLGFQHRIVDLGFMDKWWILEDKMKDFDVNETEFSNFAASPIKIVT